ncbi:lysosome-associated membrane glycoprotein 1 [Anabrus simplex]|uniref:lysosome-associated membrane glycoprotein 1 n=1 Tax=Anabrus simplex TaxID=316456 RepID=UPI0035A37812
MLLKLGLLVLFASVLAVSRGDDMPPEPLPKNGSTTEPPTTTPTTNSTTTVTTSSSTTISSTPSTPSTPTPTTPASTTSTSTTSAAPTMAPNVTTTAATPTTVPPPAAGKWTVKDNTTNVTCIMANLAIQVDVILTLDANKTSHTIFDVPSNATAEDNQCHNDTQSLKLTWNDESLVFRFIKNGTSFLVSQIALNTTINSTRMIFMNEEEEFRTPVSKSYRCAKAQEIKLIESGNSTAVAVLKVNNVQWEAFHEKTDTNFSAAEDCAGSSSPDIVPIAVGCALVGLVAIVLIAYLVGRRRSQARGYLSM